MISLYNALSVVVAIIGTSALLGLVAVAAHLLVWSHPSRVDHFGDCGCSRCEEIDRKIADDEWRAELRRERAEVKRQKRDFPRAKTVGR